MTIEIAGAGHIGLALEATYGTYVAPTKYVPFTAESLVQPRTDPWRSPIIGQNMTMGKVKGRKHVEGAITMELLPEVFVYFLIASRWGDNIQKSGVGPYVYTATNGKAARLDTQTLRSLSLSVKRGGLGFAYVGCQVGGLRFFFEDGIPYVEAEVRGVQQTENYASPGTPTVPAETPFAADECTVSIAASARTDLDSLEINFNDNPEVRQNLSGQEASDYVKWGEHVGEASFESDFTSKADYAIWEARTVQELILDCNKSANQIVNVELHGGLYDAYEVSGAGALGDLIRASASIRSVYNVAASAGATITVTTTENVTLA
jgi:hypothetical protein